MNIRHISIFNELKLLEFPSGGQFSFQILKNIGVVQLNKSKKYKIKNLSIDVGSTINYIKNVYFADTREFGIPFRFYLDDNPLTNAFNKTKSAFPLGSVFVNNSVVSDPDKLNATVIDVVDSSNVNFSQGFYYNSLGLNLLSGNPEIFSQVIKTETVAEYNFFNLSYSRSEEGTTISNTIITSNNDISDFDFQSKTFDYLCFTPFPYLKFFVLSGSQVINILCNFTVNFDLIED